MGTMPSCLQGLAAPYSRESRHQESAPLLSTVLVKTLKVKPPHLERKKVSIDLFIIIAIVQLVLSSLRRYLT